MYDEATLNYQSSLEKKSEEMIIINATIERIDRQRKAQDRNHNSQVELLHNRINRIITEHKVVMPSIV